LVHLEITTTTINEILDGAKIFKYIKVKQRLFRTSNQGTTWKGSPSQLQIMCINDKVVDELNLKFSHMLVLR